jgi:hypothetical protein
MSAGSAPAKVFLKLKCFLGIRTQRIQCPRHGEGADLPWSYRAFFPDSLSTYVAYRGYERKEEREGNI